MAFKSLGARVKQLSLKANSITFYVSLDNLLNFSKSQFTSW